MPDLITTILEDETRLNRGRLDDVAIPLHLKHYTEQEQQALQRPGFSSVLIFIIGHAAMITPGTDVNRARAVIDEKLLNKRMHLPELESIHIVYYQTEVIETEQLLKLLYLLTFHGYKVYDTLLTQEQRTLLQEQTDARGEVLERMLVAITKRVSRSMAIGQSLLRDIQSEVKEGKDSVFTLSTRSRLIDKAIEVVPEQLVHLLIQGVVKHAVKRYMWILHATEQQTNVESQVSVQVSKKTNHTYDLAITIQHTHTVFFKEDYALPIVFVGSKDKPSQVDNVFIVTTPDTVDRSLLTTTRFKQRKGPSGDYFIALDGNLTPDDKSN